MGTKELKTEAVLSVTTGILLCDFSEMHEAAEWIAGHPIWTHEFADRDANERLRQAVFAQHPQLEACERPVCNPETVDAVVAGLRKRFGATLAIEQGGGTRTESPLESVARMFPEKPVIAVVK